MNALIGTPAGASNPGETHGHWRAGGHRRRNRGEGIAQAGELGNERPQREALGVPARQGCGLGGQMPEQISQHRLQNQEESLREAAPGILIMGLLG